MTSIKVNIDRATGEISVENNGSGIPVEMHKTQGVYVPELIFAHLLAGSNFNDKEKKTTGGRNGGSVGCGGGWGSGGGGGGCLFAFSLTHPSILSALSTPTHSSRRAPPGYGAKLCNIFSKRFTVETSHKLSGRRYTQTFTDNMGVFGEASIDKARAKDFTRITYLPDYERFVFVLGCGGGGLDRLIG